MGKNDGMEERRGSRDYCALYRKRVRTLHSSLGGGLYRKRLGKGLPEVSALGDEIKGGPFFSAEARLNYGISRIYRRPWHI